MRLGVGSYTYPRLIAAGGLDVSGLLAEAHRLGADAVQCCENLPVDDLPEREFRDVLGRAADLGLTVELGVRELHDPDRIRRAADRAAQAGSGFLRLVTTEPLAQAHPRLDRLLPLPVPLALENYEASSVRAYAAWARDAGQLLVLDTLNSLGRFEGTAETVAALAGRTVCLHVKDGVARRAPLGLGFEIIGTPAGAGGLDLPWLLGQMTPGCLSVTLEHWLPEGSDEIEAARTGIAALRSARAQAVEGSAL